MTSVTVGVAPIKVTVGGGLQGPPGPPGEPGFPAPVGLTDGRMLAVSAGEWVDVPPPAGTGDMQALIYDPLGRSTNVFELENHQGVIDAGVFT